MTSGERLALIAHELRSPVAALQALAERGSEIPAGSLGRVAELATAAGRDIERLLADPDLLSLRLESVELDTILDSLARPGVTCSSESIVLVCDPTRMRQALGNLAANGLRHGTAVTVAGSADGGRVVIAVRDNGLGVAPGTAVFERGFSGVGSSGYGLWVARAIAQAHGGELVVESTPGAGATFTLSVPTSAAGRD